MTDVTAARSRSVSLAVKLIVATVLLLAAAVGAGAYFSLDTIADLAETEAASRRAAGEAAIRLQAELLARNVASSAAPAMAEGNSGYLKSLVANTLKEDQRIEWLLLADAVNGRVVARTDGAPAREALADGLVGTVAASAAGEVPWERDAADPTRFTFGAAVRVKEHVVGQLRMGISTRALEDELAAAIAAARTRAHDSARAVLLVAGLILTIGILLALVQAIRITRPVQALTAQAARIASGDFDQRIAVTSGDEIGQLARSFNFMSESLSRLMHEVAGKAAMQREMALARGVQEQMSPPATPIAVGPLRLIGSCEMSDECGGDWWTYRALPGGRLLLVVGDVTGHGLPSAMIAASARGAVEAIGPEPTPEDVLHAIDRAIRDVGRGRLVMTCFAALIDPAKGTVHFANAGQTFPIIRRAPNPNEAVQLGVLAARGNPLGDPGGVFFETGTAAFLPGDLLVLYTDGIADRLGANAERFGERRFRKLVATALAATGENRALELRDRIAGGLRDFAGAVAADDDMTLVVCELPLASLRQAA